MSALKPGMSHTFGSMYCLLLKQLPGSNRWLVVNQNNGSRFYECGGWTGTVRLGMDDIDKHHLVQIRDAFYGAGLAPDPKHCDTCTCV